MSLRQVIRFSLKTNALGKVPHWSPRHVARVQERRLRRLLRFAVARSAYYREKFRGADVGHCPLSHLPSTTKEELRNNLDRVLTDRRIATEQAWRFAENPDNLGRWYLGRYAVCHTSGSQGPPLLIIQERRCIELLFAVSSARYSAAARPGLFEGLRRLRVPRRVAIVTFRPGFYPSGSAFEFMQEIVGPFVRVQRFSSTQDNLLRELRRFQPHVMVGYASVLAALAMHTEELALRELALISNTGEQLTPQGRTRLESAFGVPVTNHYGVGECLWLSDGCNYDGGIHINSDWAIVEVVDDLGNPVPPHTTGSRILLTNLANRVQPFIRYEIADRIAVSDQPCPCGNHLPRIVNLAGRSSEVFWVRDGDNWRHLPGVLFHTAIDALGVVREFQAIQHEQQRIEILLEPTQLSLLAPGELQQRLIARLRAWDLPSDVVVEVRLVPHLAPDPTTGKMRRMISHVQPPPHSIL